MPPEGVRHTGTAYVVFLTPDVCLTPMGPNVVPVPYPIIGVFNNVALVAQSVRMCGRPTFTTASQVTRVQGDEAGPFGVKSGTNRSICESVTASTTVRAEGNYILRDGDVMKMNNGNTLGKVVYMPGVGPMIVDNPSDYGFWDAAWDDLKETFEIKSYLLDLAVPGAGQAYNKINSVANDPAGTILDATPGVGQVYQSYKEIGKYSDAYKKGGIKAVAGRVTAEAAKAAAQYATGEILDTAAPNAADTTKMDTAPPADPDPADTIKDPPANPNAGDTLKGVGPPANPDPNPGDTLKGVGPPADPNAGDTINNGPTNPNAGDTLKGVGPPADTDAATTTEMDAAKTGKIGSVRVTAPPPQMKFATAEEAAIDAMQRINSRANKEGFEYGGWIRRNPDGTYSYDAAARGSPVDMYNMPPKGPNDVAWYHTHPKVPNYDGENFSDVGDMTYSQANTAVGYVATPSGAIKKYDPSTRTVTNLPHSTPQAPGGIIEGSP
jgi:hypothetical protein